MADTSLSSALKGWQGISCKRISPPKGTRIPDLLPRHLLPIPPQSHTYARDLQARQPSFCRKRWRTLNEIQQEACRIGGVAARVGQSNCSAGLISIPLSKVKNRSVRAAALNADRSRSFSDAGPSREPSTQTTTGDGSPNGVPPSRHRGPGFRRDPTERPAGPVLPDTRDFLSFEKNVNAAVDPEVSCPARGWLTLTCLRPDGNREGLSRIQSHV
jgi:hypothetical protein